MDEILKSLHVIQDFCNKKEKCKGCDLAKDGICCIADVPIGWDLEALEIKHLAKQLSK